MSKREPSIALVCGPGCELETEALRCTLEYFGLRVIAYWLGRPQDFMSILSGEDLYPDIEVLVLNFHGDEGAFIMPELGEDVYEESEPRGNFGPQHIKQFANLPGKVVLANGCSLGSEQLALAFLESGCQTYIGPDDYPDGNTALMFAIRFFYERMTNQKSVKEAFLAARSLDEESSMYRIFER